MSRTVLRALLLAAFARFAAASAATPELPAMPAIGPDARVLIVSPHPDDESPCCGGLIATRRAGAAVSIVWNTSGGGFGSMRCVQKKARPKRPTCAHCTTPHRRGRERGA